MKFEITSRWTGAVLVAIEAGSLKIALEAAVSQNADLSGANLRGADLGGANLSWADLYGADLSGANLSGANLSGADLYGANLRGADLGGANLSGANLYGADLSGANFRGAEFRGADLSVANLYGAKNAKDMRLDTGETLEEFCAVVVPALMKAGGHPVPDEAWTCHSWNNCPMAAAFKVDDVHKIPLVYQPRVRQFVQLFDAGLIMKPANADEGTTDASV